jgi:hypothetical protein
MIRCLYLRLIGHLLKSLELEPVIFQTQPAHLELHSLALISVSDNLELGIAKTCY